MDARAVKSNANIAIRYGCQMSGYGHPMRMRLKQILDILSGCWNADILCGGGNTAILWGCRSIETLSECGHPMLMLYAITSMLLKHTEISYVDAHTPFHTFIHPVVGKVNKATMT